MIFFYAKYVFLSYLTTESAFIVYPKAPEHTQHPADVLPQTHVP